MAENTRGAALRRAIETCIQPSDEAIANLGELFTDDVSVWSPNIMATGLGDLAQNLGFREAAFSDVTVEIDSLDVFADRALAEFHVAATFTGPFVVDEAVAGALRAWRTARTSVFPDLMHRLVALQHGRRRDGGDGAGG